MLDYLYYLQYIEYSTLHNYNILICSLILLDAFTNLPTQRQRQDNFITFEHITIMTDLAPPVAKANRGGPGTA